MTFLRHAGRHVHKSVLDYLDEQLTALDWRSPTQSPYGATPITIVSKPVVMGDRPDEAIAPGLIAVTLGDELVSTMEELGGPLAVQEYPMFVDIFQDSEATAIALATDVRDIFMGRLPGSQRFLAVKNGATGAVVEGWKIEFEDIERVRPETTMPYHWQVVKVTCATYFPEEVY